MHFGGTTAIYLVEFTILAHALSTLIHFFLLSEPPEHSADGVVVVLSVLGIGRWHGEVGRGTADGCRSATRPKHRRHPAIAFVSLALLGRDLAVLDSGVRMGSARAMVLGSIWVGVEY